MMIRTIAYIGALMLVFSIPWENSLTIQELGTLTRLIGGGAAAAWMISVFETMRFRKLRWIHAILLLFILWNISTLFWSTDVEETILRGKTYAQLGVMLLMFWDLFDTPKAFQSAMQAYVLGGFVSIFGTLQSFLFARESGVRFVAAGFNPNDLSLVLVLGIPLAWYLINDGQTKLGGIGLRMVNLIYIPAAFMALFLTASRGSMIASVPALLYIVFSLPRYRWSHRVLILIAACAFVVYLLPLIPQSNIERLASVKESVSRFDLGGRTRIWRDSVGVFMAHPLLGTGSGVLSTHNIFLSVLAETGLVGLSLFLVGIFGLLYEALKMAKRKVWIGIVLFVVLLLGGLAHTWEDRKPTWLIFSFIVIGAKPERERRYVTTGRASSKIGYSIEGGRTDEAYQ